VDLDAASLRDTLEAALAARAGRPQLAGDAGTGAYRLRRPDLPGWSEVVDDSLRLPGVGNAPGAVPRLAFSAEALMRDVGGRRIFSPRPDLCLMHLSHPLIQKALSILTRLRLPTGEDERSRWTVRRGELPAGAEALILFSLEELAVNELREPLHHWVRTFALPVREGSLGRPLADRPACEWRAGVGAPSPDDADSARDLLLDLEGDLKRFIVQRAAEL
jgi:hypothetical protein